MKKIIILLMICTGVLAGCKKEEVVQIDDKMFLEQVNDVYINPDEYLGKKIKYEGIFEQHEVAEGEQDYNVVFRYGPGCCGDDGVVGFEVLWDKEYPKKDDWVEVVGVLVNNDEDGYRRLQLELDELTVLPTRGEEVVGK